MHDHETIDLSTLERAMREDLAATPIHDALYAEFGMAEILGEDGAALWLARMGFDAGAVKVVRLVHETLSRHGTEAARRLLLALEAECATIALALEAECEEGRAELRRRAGT